MTMKKAIFHWMALFVIVLSFAVSPVSAQDGDGVSFGIRPTIANEDRPETFSYFSYEMHPGDQLTDEALVMNSGSAAVTLKLYAADGNTAQNGGTSFTSQGEVSNGGSRGVSTWISLTMTDISLAPGEEVIVPFQLTVPADAAPGQHIAGLVVEALPVEDQLPTPAGGTDQANFTVNVIRRAGVAVVVDVPGTHTAGLEVTGASLYRQSDLGATFVVGIHNTGNILIKPVGFLCVNDANAAPLLNVPLSLDTILPGDETIYYITTPTRFNDGDYLLCVSLDYEGGTTALSGVGMKVRNGQPETAAEPGNGPTPDIITEISGSPLTDFIQANLKVLVIFGFLIFCFVILSITFFLLAAGSRQNK
jgi:hypothetical protein